MPKGPHGGYKLTPEIKIKLENLAMMDAPLSEMACVADVNEKTIRNWMNADPAWAEHLERLRQHTTLRARQTAAKNVSTPEGAAFWLERKAKKEFNTRPDPADLPGATPPVVNVIIKQCPAADGPDVEVQQ